MAAEQDTRDASLVIASGTYRLISPGWYREGVFRPLSDRWGGIFGLGASLPL